MRERYPTTDRKTLLYKLYEACSEGEPVAVTDDGRLVGVLDPFHVFETLSAGVETGEVTTSGFHEGTMPAGEAATEGASS